MADAMELARQYGALIERKKQNDSDKTVISKEMESIEEQLVTAMSEAGSQAIKLESGMTLYRATDRFYGAAEGVSKDELIIELGRHPQTMDLVAPNYNANSLRARIKEMAELGESLPEGLAQKLHITEKFRVRHRSS